MSTTDLDVSTGVDLTTLGDDLLRRARDAGSGRAAASLLAGRDGTLSQTVLALRAGATLADHVAPGPATLQVLRGRCRLACGDHEVPLSTGCWATVPTATHHLDADTDVLALLTVVRPTG